MPYADRWHGFSTSCCGRCKESAAAERAPVHEVLEVGADVGVVVLHVASRGLYGSGLDRHLQGQLLCIPQPILLAKNSTIILKESQRAGFQVLCLIHAVLNILSSEVTLCAFNERKALNATIVTTRSWWRSQLGSNPVPSGHAG